MGERGNQLTRSNSDGGCDLRSDRPTDVWIKLGNFTRSGMTFLPGVEGLTRPTHQTIKISKKILNFHQGLAKQANSS